MIGDFGLGEIIIIVFTSILLSIPVILVWLLFKMLKKVSHHNEQIEQEVRRIREELQAMKESMSGSSPKIT